jgi:hypothetical protein
MGEAVARRIGGGRRVVLADFSAPSLERTRAALCDVGHDVIGVITDVSSPESVDRLARTAVRGEHGGPLRTHGGL